MCEWILKIIAQSVQKTGDMSWNSDDWHNNDCNVWLLQTWGDNSTQIELFLTKGILAIWKNIIVQQRWRDSFKDTHLSFCDLTHMALEASIINNFRFSWNSKSQNSCQSDGAFLFKWAVLAFKPDYLQYIPESCEK